MVLEAFGFCSPLVTVLAVHSSRQGQAGCRRVTAFACSSLTSKASATPPSLSIAAPCAHLAQARFLLAKPANKNLACPAVQQKAAGRLPPKNH